MIPETALARIKVNVWDCIVALYEEARDDEEAQEFAAYFIGLHDALEVELLERSMLS